MCLTGTPWNRPKRDLRETNLDFKRNTLLKFNAGKQFKQIPFSITSPLRIQPLRGASRFYHGVTPCSQSRGDTLQMLMERVLKTLTAPITPAKKAQGWKI